MSSGDTDQEQRAFLDEQARQQQAFDASWSEMQIQQAIAENEKKRKRMMEQWGGRLT